jgi:ribosomal protein S18 acetylase RimI-like enzyme
MFRIIEKDSIDLIEPLWVLLNDMHKEFDRKTGQPVRTTVWSERRRQLLDKSGNKTSIELLYENGELAGYCYSTISEVGTGEIESLFVDEKIRCKGYGKLFVESALAFFERNNAAGIMIWVHPANTRAASFYRRFGFEGGPYMKRLPPCSV